MSKPHIMIIDDDRSNTYMLSIAVEMMGCEPLIYHNGHAAINSLRHGTRPQAILLDYHLPLTHSNEVLATVRELDPTHSIPVIYVSADTRIKRFAKENGISHVLVKPFDYQDLRKTIAQLGFASA